MLVARHDPLVTQFFLDFDADFTQPVQDGAVVDLDDGADTESVTLAVPFNVPL